MKKRIVALLFSLLLALSGCGVASDVPPEDKSATTGETKDIYIFISSPEYSDAMTAAIEEYRSIAPDVNIRYETTQSDYNTLLNVKINAGETPDIFSTTAGGEIEAYALYSFDLSGQPLADEMTEIVRQATTVDGKMMGFPITTQSFGLIYNKDIFQRAGIETPPQTLQELRDVCEKLTGTGVQPFSTGYKEWWVYKHLFQHFQNAAQPDDVEGLVRGFLNGQNKLKDYPVLSQSFFDFVDITVRYGDAQPLETDLAMQLENFAKGKVAMIVGQGPWVEKEIRKMSPYINIGFAGYPVSDDAEQCRLIVGVDQILRVHKDSESLDEVLAFCNWLYGSPYGKSWFGSYANALPPVEGAAYPDGDIARATQQYLKTGSAGRPAIVYSLDSFNKKFGEIMQSYIAGAYSRDDAIQEIEKEWQLLGAPTNQ